MKTHRIAGGGGVQLHVVEAGNPDGRPILFLHGFSQSCLAWSRQLDSELARDHRLVAMDQHKAGLPHAQVDLVPNVAHTPFWEDSSAFNQRLRAFVEMCSAVAPA